MAYGDKMNNLINNTASNSPSLQSIIQGSAKNVYGNSTDLSNARSVLGNSGYNYIDTSAQGYSAPTSYDGSIVVGGAGASGGVADSGNATRLWGANRDETANAISQYASGLKNSSIQSQPQTQQIPQQSAIQVYNPTDDINRMKEYQKQQALAGLGKARDSSLSNLDAEKQGVAPQYYKKREIESTGSQLGAKNFAEFMASRGQANAGASLEGELNRTSTLQRNIGDLNTQEQGTLNDIGRRVTNTNNAYESDVASSNAGIEASALQQLIQAQQHYNDTQLNQANTDRTFNYQVGRDNVNDTGKLANGQWTQSGQLNNNNIQKSAAELKEMTDPNSVTNQMAKLGLQTAQLNYAYLPDQLKGQAQLILQQLAKGNIDIQTAQVQLNYLPTQLQTGIDAQKADIRQGDERLAIERQNANTAAYSASKSGSSSSAKEETTAAYNDAAKSLLAAQDKGQATTWINTYKNDLIDAIGIDNFNKLVKNNYDANVNTANDAKYRQANRNT